MRNPRIWLTLAALVALPSTFAAPAATYIEMYDATPVLAPSPSTPSGWTGNYYRIDTGTEIFYDSGSNSISLTGQPEQSPSPRVLTCALGEMPSTCDEQVGVCRWSNAAGPWYDGTSTEADFIDGQCVQVGFWDDNGVVRASYRPAMRTAIQSPTAAFPFDGVWTSSWTVSFYENGEHLPPDHVASSDPCHVQTLAGRHGARLPIVNIDVGSCVWSAVPNGGVDLSTINPGGATTVTITAELLRNGVPELNIVLTCTAGCV